VQLYRSIEAKARTETREALSCLAGYASDTGKIPVILENSQLK
jgi:hypothetical protein